MRIGSRYVNSFADIALTEKDVVLDNSRQFVMTTSRDNYACLHRLGDPPMLLHRFAGHTGTVWRAAYSGGRDFVSVGFDDDARHWDLVRCSMLKVAFLTNT